MSAAAKALEPPSGMEHEVGLLFAQLEETRRRTRELVLGMSTADLDRRAPGYPHSVAAHVFHIAAVEYWWMRHVVLGEGIPADVDREFAAALLDSPASRELSGRDAGYYLGKLDEVRAHTEAACWKLRDADLDRERTDPRDGARATVRWILCHIADHEAQHRGHVQILLQLAAGARGA